MFETEMMMSKTNDTSKLDRAKIENRVLADSELDAVSGGMGLLGGIPGYSVPPPQHHRLPGLNKYSNIELKRP
jgi:hypothetical protein